MADPRKTKAPAPRKKPKPREPGLRDYLTSAANVALGVKPSSIARSGFRTGQDIGRYIRSTTPGEVGRTGLAVAKALPGALYDSFREDPTGFLGSLMPGAEVVNAVREGARLRSEGKPGEAFRVERAAVPLEALNLAPIGGIGVGAKAAAKAAVRGGRKAVARVGKAVTKVKPIPEADDAIEGSFRVRETGAPVRKALPPAEPRKALPAPPRRIQPEDYVGLIEEADAGLPHEAGRAITEFVGHEPGTYARGVGTGYGVMLPRRLEAAFEATPDEEALLVREQLDQAFAPVRSRLGEVAGDTLKLYRYQRPVSEPGIEPQTRNVLSWTVQPGVAREFAGARREPFSLWSEDLIRQAEEAMAQSGRAKVGPYAFVRNEEYPEYTDLYRNGEYQTDLDTGVRQYLEDDNAYLQRLNDEREALLQNVQEAYVPLDDIVWATNRAGQHEFIVRNRPGAPFAIDKRGVLGGSEFKRGGFVVKRKKKGA